MVRRMFAGKVSGFGIIGDVSFCSSTRTGDPGLIQYNPGVGLEKECIDT
jgi:hypothetical protein